MFKRNLASRLFLAPIKILRIIHPLNQLSSPFVKPTSIKLLVQVYWKRYYHKNSKIWDCDTVLADLHCSFQRQIKMLGHLVPENSYLRKLLPKNLQIKFLHLNWILYKYKDSKIKTNLGYAFAKQWLPEIN